MIRVGLTQRVEVVSAYGERRDCLDQNWTRLLGCLGLVPVPLGNAVVDVAGYVDALSLAGVVLTGGNDLAHAEGACNPAPERDRFEADLLGLCRQRRLPVLGVCRGMQLINHYFDGELRLLPGHAGTRHRIRCRELPFAAAGDSITVGSYHDHGIPSDGLGSKLRPLAWAEDGSIEALADDSGLIHGIMWHPEREPGFADRDLRMLDAVFRGGTR